MLSKKSRIPRKLFPELLLNSKYTNSSAFSLRFVIPVSMKETRVGVSVSKKISKSAVVRNRVRRRAYTALAAIISNLPSGLFLFVAKSGVEKLRGEKLKDELKKLLGKAPFVLENKKS
jgi:ribonuclease P protein component